MKYLAFIPLLVFTLFSSCKKDDNQVSSQQLEFGNTANMDIQALNNIVTPHNQDLIGYDVNNNGTVDLKFSLYHSSTGSDKDLFGVILYSPSKELSMNGFFIADTTFLYKSISIIEDSNSNKVWVTEISNFNCYQLNSTDTVSNTFSTNFKIQYYGASDKLSSDNTYSTVFDFPLWQSESSGIPNIDSVSGDTTFLRQDQYGESCYSMGTGVKYLSFKLKDSQKLGWIKLKYDTNNSIEIFEVAIQK